MRLRFYFVAPVVLAFLAMGAISVRSSAPHRNNTAMTAELIPPIVIGKPTLPPRPPTTVPPTTAPTTVPPTTVPPTIVATTTKPPPKTQRARTTSTDPPEGNQGAADQTLARIARCEGYPDYVNRDHPGPSTASGKYGALEGTWGGYAGYDSAAEAPEEIQDEWARELYARAGTTPWRASRSCWGR